MERRAVTRLAREVWIEGTRPDEKEGVDTRVFEANKRDAPSNPHDTSSLSCAIKNFMLGRRGSMVSQLHDPLRDKEWVRTQFQWPKSAFAD